MTAVTTTMTTTMMTGPHYVLRLQVPAVFREMYTSAATEHNRLQTHPNAGFDLFCPEEVKVYGHTTAKIDQGVKGAMEFFSGKGEGKGGQPVGYFMFPRSSTGSKTPLRLANSVGIIDAGYRGNYIAVFDNWQEASFKVECGQRLVQICPPNLTYPLQVLLVDELLDMDTERGTGGFGSTGS
jgi:dUTP pyrophosphatase